SSCPVLLDCSCSRAQHIICHPLVVFRTISFVPHKVLSSSISCSSVFNNAINFPQSAILHFGYAVWHRFLQMWRFGTQTGPPSCSTYTSKGFRLRLVWNVSRESNRWHLVDQWSDVLHIDRGR